MFMVILKSVKILVRGGITMKTYTDYFFDEPAFDLHDGGYVPLAVSDAPEKPLNVPPLLKPDKETATDVYYTVTAEAGETQLLPGAKTSTGMLPIAMMRLEWFIHSMCMEPNS